MNLSTFLSLSVLITIRTKHVRSKPISTKPIRSKPLRGSAYRPLYGSQIKTNFLLGSKCKSRG